MNPKSVEQARQIVGQYVEHYNNKRLHSAIAYVTLKDMLEGNQKKILKERDQKLENARWKRKEKRHKAQNEDEIHKNLPLT